MKEGSLPQLQIVFLLYIIGSQKKVELELGK